MSLGAYVRQARRLPAGPSDSSVPGTTSRSESRILSQLAVFVFVLCFVACCPLVLNAQSVTRTSPGSGKSPITSPDRLPWTSKTAGTFWVIIIGACGSLLAYVVQLAATRMRAHFRDSAFRAFWQFRRSNSYDRSSDLPRLGRKSNFREPYPNGNRRGRALPRFYVERTRHLS